MSDKSSLNSETPLTAIPEPLHEQDGTTFFLLDVETQGEPSEKKKGKKPMRTSDNEKSDSSDSSSSSVSAQVVIDHGNIPRRMNKNVGHLMRSGDDESESDYAFCYSPTRRESDADSVTKQRLPDHSHLHITESYDHETDLSAADEEPAAKKKAKRRRHKHKTLRKHLSPRKGMVTVYTEEDDDLVDEMPTGDRERMLRHSERRHELDHRRRSIPRRLHKRTQKVLQTNLQSQSWSRRESLQSSRHPGLSSEDALS
jgi:hypothetical protein